LKFSELKTQAPAKAFGGSFVLDMAREPLKYPKLGKIGDSLLLSHFSFWFYHTKVSKFYIKCGTLISYEPLLEISSSVSFWGQIFATK